MPVMTAAYCHKRIVQLPYDAAIARTREALAAEGFGVLTEIDLKATFQKKLQLDFRPYTILGACNPTLSHKALSEEIDIGVLLPCNVVVYEGDNTAESVVAAIDPEVSLGRVGNPDLEPLATEVKQRLRRAVNAI